jgi:hypothetical protein
MRRGSKTAEVQPLRRARLMPAELVPAPTATAIFSLLVSHPYIDHAVASRQTVHERSAPSVWLLPLHVDGPRKVAAQGRDASEPPFHAD